MYLYGNIKEQYYIWLSSIMFISYPFVTWTTKLRTISCYSATDYFCGKSFDNFYSGDISLMNKHYVAFKSCGVGKAASTSALWWGYSGRLNTRRGALCWKLLKPIPAVFHQNHILSYRRLEHIFKRTKKELGLRRIDVEV